MTYTHTQSRSILAVLVAAAALAMLVPALFFPGPGMFIGPLILAVVAVVAFAFSSLTTVVDDGAVTATFRWGRPRRRIPFEEISEAEVVRNPWLYGWGLRLIPGATMFNVWGLDAVHLHLKGARDFRIGTDDPQGLVDAVNGRLIPSDR